MDLKKYIRSIPDYPKEGILFRDITTLIKNAEAFKYTNDKIIELASQIDFDKVAAIESRGFILACALALKYNKGMILLRKPGKLPGKIVKTSYALEYGNATMEIQKDVIQEGQRVLICDDLLATGGTAKAAAKLIEKIKGTIVGFAFIIELLELNGREKIKEYRSESLVEY